MKTVQDMFGPLRAAVSTAAVVQVADTLSSDGIAHSLQLFEDVLKVPCKLRLLFF